MNTPRTDRVPYAPPMAPPANPDSAAHLAEARLAALSGPAEQRAVLLALLLTPGSQRERRAWQDETRGLSTARALHGHVHDLGATRRLPWFERTLLQLAKASLPDRQALLEAARRVMSADGQIRPIDRLHWLALRHRLGETMPLPSTPNAHNEMSQLSLHSLREVARVSAYLARLVPDASAAAGQAWYAAVMGNWLAAPHLPPCDAPDADGLVNALTEVQSLPWMLRPVLVRAWLDAAVAHSPPHAMQPDAADALRLVILLLDCPLPPELARHYIEPASPP